MFTKLFKERMEIVKIIYLFGRNTRFIIIYNELRLKKQTSYNVILNHISYTRFETIHYRNVEGRIVSL